jgi:hypothetical protein
VYALGASLCTLLLGAAPAPDVAAADPERVALLDRLGVPRELTRAMALAMAVRTEHRFPSVQHFAAAISPLVSYMADLQDAPPTQAIYESYLAPRAKSRRVFTENEELSLVSEAPDSSDSGGRGERAAGANHGEQAPSSEASGSDGALTSARSQPFDPALSVTKSMTQPFVDLANSTSGLDLDSSDTVVQPPENTGAESQPNPASAAGVDAPPVVANAANADATSTPAAMGDDDLPIATVVGEPPWWHRLKEPKAVAVVVGATVLTLTLALVGWLLF